MLSFALIGSVGPIGAAEPTVKVINAGIGGHSSADLLARVERDVVAQKPDLVVLLVGANDMLNPKRFATLASYQANLERLVARLREIKADVLLLTTLPCHAPYLFQRHGPEAYNGRDPNAKLLELNETIRTVARARRLPVVELYAEFEASGATKEKAESLLRNLANSPAADGVHPTAKGYERIAQLVFAEMRKQSLLAKRRIVCFGDSITYGAHMPGQGTTTGETYPARLMELLRTAAK